MNALKTILTTSGQQNYMPDKKINFWGMTDHE